MNQVSDLAEVLVAEEHGPPPTIEALAERGERTRQRGRQRIMRFASAVFVVSLSVVVVGQDQRRSPDSSGTSRFVTERPSPGPSSHTTTGFVIQHPGEVPKVAALGILLTAPPSGGVVALEEWDWSLVDHERFDDGTLFSEDPVEVRGVWLGAALRTQSVHPIGRNRSSVAVQGNRVSECASNDAMDEFYAIVSSSAELLGWNEELLDGTCAVTAYAIWENSVIEELRSLGDSSIRVETLVRTL